MAFPAEEETDKPDFGTAERHDKGVIRIVDIAPGVGYQTVKAAKDVESSTLDRLFNRGLIEQELYDAGNRLHEDWFFAGLEPSITVNLNKIRGGPHERTERQIDAKKRFDAAMRNVGSYLNDSLYEIIILDKNVSDIERSHGWGKGTGMPVIKIALTKLAEYYGVI